MKNLLLCCTVALSLASFRPMAGAAPSADALRQLGGKVVEQGGRIIELNIDASKFTEAEYRQIGECTALRKLTLNGKTLTDVTLPLLAGLTELEEFSTNQSMLSDAGYRHFAPFQKLRGLSLWHPSWADAGFTGSGLAELRTLPALQRLTFAGSTAGDEALAAIGQLTQLQSFQTWHTAQTQAGNQHLLQLTNLTFLKIGQRLPKAGKPAPPSFDDSTIATLARMKSLESLELFEARLTAKSLTQLQALPKLRKLKIHTAEISAAEIETLRTALPGVIIDFQPISEADREATLAKKLKL